jgi:hypothetical protein
MDHGGKPRSPRRSSRATRGGKYRLRIAKAEENELERLPLEVALSFESHLQRMVELAGETSSGDALWTDRDAESGLLRFERQGFCVLYDVDRETESVIVSSIKRVVPSGSSAASGSFN